MYLIKLLVVLFGCDVFGNLVVVDLFKMLYLLIVGLIGSGKLVVINVMIMGLLMNMKLS